VDSDFEEYVFITTANHNVLSASCVMRFYYDSTIVSRQARVRISSRQLVSVTYHGGAGELGDA
jgi:hypothetical protein